MTPVFVSTIFYTAKIIVLISLTLYLIFAGVMVRQEQLMANVLEEGFEPILRLITIIHLLLTIGLILLAFFLL